MGYLNLICGVILLPLLVWVASSGMASVIAPGNPFTGLLGAAFLFAAFLYFLLRRTKIFSQSKGIVADLHILLGSAGFGLIIAHSGAKFFSPTGLLTLMLTLLFLLGLNLRFLSTRQSYRNFASRIHLFANPARGEGGLDHLLQAKEALLPQIDPRAVEGTFSLRLHDWIRHPWRAGHYLWLVWAEKRWVRQVCGRPPAYLRLSQGWGRYFHIGLALAAVIGFLCHLIQSCPYFH